MQSMLEPYVVQHLLGRSYKKNRLNVLPFVEDRVVLVTGAGGSIGSELCLQLIAMQPKTLILYEMSEYALYQIDRRLRDLDLGAKIVPIMGNLTSLAQLVRLLQVYEVKTIYHAAAYKHVPLVERNPIVGLENNVWGAKTLVDAAREIGVPNLILVSTDKAVNPTNVMGASKRLAEYIALSSQSPYKVVRFGNVLWSTGSVLPLFYEQLRAGRAVTITHRDVSRYFMSIDEAVDLILQSTVLEHPICVLDMGESVKIEDIAYRLAALMKVTGIQVKYIGLRPGEKLHEELTLGEELQKTEHPNIKYAQESQPNYEEVSGWLRQIKILCNKGDVGGLRVLLSKIIPGYNPSCGIVDDIWIEENVVKARMDLDDCYTPTR